MTDTFDQVDTEEVDAVEPDQDEDQVTDQAEDEGDESDDEGSQDPEDELEEIERDGKKYRVSKALKDDLLRHADYTRKTQEAAAKNREADARIAAFDTATKEIDDKAFELKAVDKRLADLEALSHQDWQEILRLDQASGTSNYDRLNREFQMLPRQREGLAGQLKAKADEVLQAKQQTLAKRWEEGQAVLARDIKGWGPELAEKLVKTATTDFGFTEQEARSLDDPRWIKVFHEAHQFREQARKSQTVQNAAKASAIKPIGSVKGNAAPKSGLSDDLPSAEWFKREREKTLARKTGSAIRR